MPSSYGYSSSSPASQDGSYTSYNRPSVALPVFADCLLPLRVFGTEVPIIRALCLDFKDDVGLGYNGVLICPHSSFWHGGRT
jgi:hypothetical protein